MLFKTDVYEVFIPQYLLIGIASLAAFLITFIAIPSLVKIASHKGLVAHPNGRTSHLIPTPNLGGVAIFTGVIISSMVFTGISTAHELKYIFAGMLILFFVGLKDDIQEIPAYQKLIGQSLASLIILLPGNFYLHSLHGLFGIHEIGFLPGVILSWFLFQVLINSLNLIDGIDGLASGIGIHASLFFGVVFLIDGLPTYAVMCFVLAASLLAFFYFNVYSKKNKIFMGDTGSMLIGLLLAIFTIKFLNIENSTLFFQQNHMAPAVGLSVLLIPLFDAARVSVVRLFHGKSPFAADRTHIHHHVLRLSDSHITATLLILSANAFFIALPWLFRNLNGEVLIILTLAVAVVLFNIPVYLNRQNEKYGIKYDFRELSFRKVG